MVAFHTLAALDSFVCAFLHAEYQRVVKNICSAHRFVVTINTYSQILSPGPVPSIEVRVSCQERPMRSPTEQTVPRFAAVKRVHDRFGKRKGGGQVGGWARQNVL
jgi:hypothetical protein|tara:strand:+ start:5971 stop:6285 length:315 start_codon:yes stop_codon:yes gene_type:complete